MRKRPKSEALLEHYRDLREAGAHPMLRREAYNAWFRQRCAEGNNPSALQIYSKDEAERFWARTVPGTDGHVFWTGSKTFRRNNDVEQKPQRWAWKKHYGELSPYTELENKCGEDSCVNVEHMQVRPRSAARIRFSDDKVIGALQVLHMRLGRAPTTTDWDEAKLPITASALLNRFGTWTKTLSLAGLEPARSRR